MAHLMDAGPAKEVATLGHDGARGRFEADVALEHALRLGGRGRPIGAAGRRSGIRHVVAGLPSAMNTRVRWRKLA